MCQADLNICSCNFFRMIFRCQADRLGGGARSTNSWTGLEAEQAAKKSWTQRRQAFQKGMPQRHCRPSGPWGKEAKVKITSVACFGCHGSPSKFIPMLSCVCVLYMRVCVCTCFFVCMCMCERQETDKQSSLSSHNHSSVPKINPLLFFSHLHAISSCCF